MRKSVRRSALAATLSFGFASFAHAVPVYFDFTGTVTVSSQAGEVGLAVSGGFNFETDRLFTLPPPSDGIQYTTVDWMPTGLTEPMGFVSIGDRSFSLPAHGLYYGGINFADGCQPECNLGWRENFNLQVISEDPFQPNFTGERRSTSLILINAYDANAFDGSALTPLDALTLPLASLLGVYNEWIYDCVDGACAVAGQIQYQYDIATVSRGVGPRSVPEPGTLGLLGAALGGLLLRRRRATQASTR